MEFHYNSAAILLELCEVSYILGRCPLGSSNIEKGKNLGHIDQEDLERKKKVQN